MKLAILVSVFMAAASTTHAGIRLAERGKARCVIVSQPGATRAEKHAARELANTLKQITGADFEIRSEAGAADSAVIIGPGPAAELTFPDIKLDQLGGEELVMRSRRNRLLLAGGRPRGTLYAVYRLLQPRCGGRWWACWGSPM